MGRGLKDARRVVMEDKHRSKQRCARSQQGQEPVPNSKRFACSEWQFLQRGCIWRLVGALLGSGNGKLPKFG